MRAQVGVAHRAHVRIALAAAWVTWSSHHSGVERGTEKTDAQTGVSY